MDISCDRFFQIGLEDFMGERVLIRQVNGCTGGIVYVPGVIQSSNTTATGSQDIEVAMDNCAPIRVCNVTSPENVRHVVSDQSPTIQDIQLHMQVCARSTPGDRFFVEGTVVGTDLNRRPPVFQIAVISPPSSSSSSATAIPSATNDLILTVSRVQIRLLRPPWYEDLMQMQESSPPSTAAATPGNSVVTTADPSPVDSSDDESKIDFSESVSNNNSNTSTPGPSRSPSKLLFPILPVDGANQSLLPSTASNNNGILENS
jgi:hypothetical protein